ncbi:hypothetical protein AK812_SmicGene40280 [Symbiodinium microadriaticum]|uniref:Uncharacterized protein n=1 Tax=Symbiodinium microadriaticum TaxID=2951 RepID=A0A1Q9C950_SYMMI|nr:hypothetical protein AK812_SmicGene40280 [Symbiodinium microadriaticum]
MLVAYRDLMNSLMKFCDQNSDCGIWYTIAETTSQFTCANSESTKCREIYDKYDHIVTGGRARNCQLTISGYSPLEIATGRRQPDLMDVETGTPPEQLSSNPPDEVILAAEPDHVIVHPVTMIRMVKCQLTMRICHLRVSSLNRILTMILSSLALVVILPLFLPEAACAQVPVPNDRMETQTWTCFMIRMVTVEDLLHEAVHTETGTWLWPFAE